MSFFKNIFGGGETSATPNGIWKNIETMADWEAAVAQSFNRKIAIFKHSTRCMISKTVLRNFEAEAREKLPDADLYFLDLIAHRDISNKIAEELHVTHQSPQLIVMRDGKSVANASHDAISAKMV